MSPSRNPNSDFSLEETAAAVPAPEVQKSTRKKRAVSIPITEDGQLDLGRVRSSEDVERARQALGMIKDVEPVVERPKVAINRAFIPTAYSLLEVIIQRTGRIFLKWPPDLASEMYFSPEKKEALIEPTAVVLERYAPLWLIENQDIAALGAALTDAVNDMVNKGVERYTAKVRASQEIPQGEQPVNGVAQVQ